MSTPSKAAMELAEEIIERTSEGFNDPVRIARLIDEKVGPLVKFADAATYTIKSDAAILEESCQWCDHTRDEPHSPFCTACIALANWQPQ